MKKYLIIILLLFSAQCFAQVGTAKLLTAADSVYDVTAQGEWLFIAVEDSGAADTVTVWFPYTDTNVGATVGYAPIGKIMDLSTGSNDTVMAGTSDTKYYVLWIPYPRAVRFLLSDNATGDVEIKPFNLPNR